MLENLCIVLVEPSHPGNIGAVARAMATMGLSRLVLVNPKQFPHEQATAQASGADSILEQAQICPDLAVAVQSCQRIIGTTARQREFPWPTATPRDCAVELATQYANTQVALVFGPEKTGLRNAEIQLCHQLIHIPTNPEFSSLNLAQAVQVICYELYQNFGDQFSEQQITPRLAESTEVEGFYTHLQQTLQQLGFLNVKAPRWLMPRLRRLFGRIQLEHHEVQILRGICSAVQRLCGERK